MCHCALQLPSPAAQRPLPATHAWHSRAPRSSHNLSPASLAKYTGGERAAAGAGLDQKKPDVDTRGRRDNNGPTATQPQRRCCTDMSWGVPCRQLPLVNQPEHGHCATRPLAVPPSPARHWALISALARGEKRPARVPRAALARPVADVYEHEPGHNGPGAQCLERRLRTHARADARGGEQGDADGVSKASTWHDHSSRRRHDEVFVCGKRRLGVRWRSKAFQRDVRELFWKERRRT